jgi:hypothetical protein
LPALQASNDKIARRVAFGTATGGTEVTVAVASLPRKIDALINRRLYCRFLLCDRRA